MDSIHIHGGVCLQGNVRIQGSKNAALPVLAATILTKETSVIRNCPKIADVYQMLNLLSCIGCEVCWEEDGVRVDAGNVSLRQMPAEAITGMRSSLCLMGAMLGRVGEVVMEYPGGCVIGDRPIDLHLEALGQMGVVFAEDKGRIRGVTPQGLHGADIRLEKASVGATENIVLAAVMAEGITVIDNAAREPEVEALCRYLKQCGALIEGIGTGHITIEGGRMLYGTDYEVPADRIVAGTYLFGCLATGGSVLLEEAPVEHMSSVLALAARMGAEYQRAEEGLYVQSPDVLKSIGLVETAPYPGFPTDMQSIVLATLTKVKGIAMIEENIFENRFRVADPLRSMGAEIDILDPRRAVIYGGRSLKGSRVEAWELRGGAALTVAGLMAEGETVIDGCQFIYRGYENICRDLRELGARIYCV